MTSFINKTQDNMVNIIQRLPPDLKTHIYKTHLWFDAEKKPICDNILHWFKRSEDAQRLTCDDKITNNLKNLINCKTCVEYLRKHDYEFNKCYNDHYIRNQKNFDLMSKFDSFVLSILMYKYH